MASHRRPRTPLLSPSSRRGAVGLTTAAIASATLLSQGPAHASPEDDRPSIEEVRERVDALYREAGSATQKYNAAKERTDEQREKVDRLLDEAAERTDRLNDARRKLGGYATAQYRTGGISGTAVLLLSDNPQDFFGQKHLMDRITDRQRQAVDDYRDQRRAAQKKRSEASASLAELTDAQEELADTKKTVQGKLAQARELLSELTAEEKARLAAAERKRQEEARRKAAAAAAERERREEARREAAAESGEQAEAPADSGTDTGTGGTDTGTGTGTADGSYAAKADKVLAFAEAQLGKPYVWGATGPNSYDCSGLTRAAWLSAGVSLPRTTYDQVEAGTRIAKAEMRPGDLVFFYDDISHVGIYAGGGQMIHAPKPGAEVRYESVDHMPFHSAVRPA
ncbi:NlpC/P60 family protein [Streptomyces chitinivorans]|uniref:NlpC/P60 family protein n=1 Tax=Streptomyces chitinivorans TaxID=1257027 RepID=A0ABW7I284_9ACTN|nr:C40 family peptidase [Streptomyces chitinivorans]MDH2407484.1 NlpC/P60 family protein [Streptomyces chitinivorans]